MASPNRFVGLCPACRLTVQALGGELHKDTYGDLKPYHIGCAPKTSAPAYPTPEPVATPPSKDALQSAADGIVERVTTKFLETVPDLVKSTMRDATRKLEITIGAAPTIKHDMVHSSFADILIALTAGTNPFIKGPAGSGKTKMCEQLASTMKLDFYMTGSVAGKHELLGFIDAKGQVVRTQFREAYEKGGLFLLDELDGSNPSVMVAFNGAIANDFCDFPDKLVKKHKNFKVIAAGNTWGTGADATYVGRYKQDAAMMDRFQIYEMPYDNELEHAIAGNDDWVKWVQSVRAACEAEKIQHIVSPRASIAGARLLAAGMERTKVEASCVWKGLDNNHKVRVMNRLSMGGSNA